jgi:hypothetical protein
VDSRDAGTIDSTLPPLAPMPSTAHGTALLVSRPRARERR